MTPSFESSFPGVQVCQAGCLAAVLSVSCALAQTSPAYKLSGSLVMSADNQQLVSIDLGTASGSQMSVGAFGTIVSHSVTKNSQSVEITLEVKGNNQNNLQAYGQGYVRWAIAVPGNSPQTNFQVSAVVSASVPSEIDMYVPPVAFGKCLEDSTLVLTPCDQIHAGQSYSQTWNSGSFKSTGAGGGVDLSAPGPESPPGAFDARIDLTIKIASCPTPDAEMTTAVSWNPAPNQTLLQFQQQVVSNSGANFNGSQIQETSPVIGSDSCYTRDRGVPGWNSTTAPFNQVSGGTWFIGANNFWTSNGPVLGWDNLNQYDNVGFAPSYVNYYQGRLGPTNGLPCKAVIYQQMTMLCPDENHWANYGSLNALTATIGSNYVQSTRARATGSRRYGPVSARASISEALSHSVILRSKGHAITPNATGVTLQLANTSVTALPGASAAFSGTVTNNGSSAIYLNGNIGTVQIPGLTLDDAVFYSGAPLSLAPGGSYTGPIFNVGIDPSVSTGNYSGSITIQGGSDTSAFTDLATQNFQLTVPMVTAPTIESVVNAASFAPEIVANAWFTITGLNLSSTTDTWANSITNGKLPTVLDGVSVQVGGKSAYIAYVSPTQINAVAPDLPAGATQVVVMNAFGSNAAADADVQSVGPAFFQWPGGYVVATRQDYSLAVADGVLSGVTTTAAKPGDVIILWGTGFGPTFPAVPAGVEVPAGQIYQAATPVSVTLTPVSGGAGASVQVYGAALSAGYAALYQVAIQIPGTLADGAYAIVAAVGGVQSPASAAITVSQ